MNPIDREATREHLLRWKRVGPVLETIRRRELREYDFEKNRDAVESLFELGVQHSRPRNSSGFIEWSRRLRIAQR